MRHVGTVDSCYMLHAEGDMLTGLLGGARSGVVAGYR